uniref:trimeric intracellular cation channel type 1B.1 isoform X1 n=2 Tax=Ciona intestinalis TaxID=7719 RepID=UPI0000522DC8|nr:trimeric intracellular cation channel type 1B.1 isoform X1 [Ciona intestinalis]|eukprot:XP_002126697.1 trimeric intracellular cation channel type 1B.1 isoform X1 [Ciona intestinalis]
MDNIQELAHYLSELTSTTLSVPCQLAHFVLVICGVKQCWVEKHYRSQPATTWCLSMICCFGGGCLVNLFVGKPMLMPLANTEALTLATLVWWLVFYTPRNAFQVTTQWFPVSVVTMLLKELIRTKKIIKGVTLAQAVYPSSNIICTFLGMLAACGGGFLKNFAFLFSSQWNGNSIQNLQCSVVTKFCTLFSFLYVLQMNGHISQSIELIALVQATSLFAFLVGNKLQMVNDPFSTAEKVLCGIFVDYTVFSRPNEESLKHNKEKKQTEKPQNNKNTKNKHE